MIISSGRGRWHRSLAATRGRGPARALKAAVRPFRSSGRNSSAAEVEQSLALPRGIEYADNDPGVVREGGAHEQQGIAFLGGHPVQVLLLHALGGELLAGLPVALLDVEDAEFPVLDHGAVRAVTIVASEHVAELERDFRQILWSVAEESELIEKRLPLGLPLRIGRLDLKVQHFRRPDDAN